MRLHNFWSSSASFRTRIALELKGIPYEYVPVKLGMDDNEAQSAAFRAKNPQGAVPLLEDGELKLQQSWAIVEYLEELKPEPRLLPADRVGRARVRSIGLFLACELQPVNNLRVRKYLKTDLGQDDAGVKRWTQHWSIEGFDKLEAQLREPGTGRFCHGDAPTAAECFLLAAAYGVVGPAIGLTLERWPTIQRVVEAGMALPAVQRAHPKQQPDAPKH